jgi:hypothetical protein
MVIGIFCCSFIILLVHFHTVNADTISTAADLAQVSDTGTHAGDQEKKERVKKKPNEDRRRQRDEDTEADEDDDDDDEQSCFSSCLSGILVDMLFSSSDEEEAVPDTIPTGPEPAVAFSEETPVQPGTYRFDQPDSTQELTSHEPSISTPTASAEPPPLDRFVLLGALSWSKTGPSDLWDEYRNGGFRLELNPFRVMPSGLQFGLTLGFETYQGEPEFEYTTSTRLESPTSSTLEFFSVGARAGQYFALGGGGGHLYWGVGPVLFWVQESADLDIYEMPSRTYLTSSETSLERWRMGGDAAFGMNWWASPGLRLGFLTRLFVIPWEGQEVESLTLDFLGKRSLVGFSIGLVIGHAGY